MPSYVIFGLLIGLPFLILLLNPSRLILALISAGWIAFGVYAAMNAARYDAEAGLNYERSFQLALRDMALGVGLLIVLGIAIVETRKWLSRRATAPSETAPPQARAQDR